ncbi:MAG: YceI family protein [Pseudomonadota bacterium]
MTKHFSSIAIAAVLTLTAGASQADPAQYKLSPSHTSLFFTVGHIGYADTLGRFGDVEGTFTYDLDTQELSDVAVTIQADSLMTWHDRRDRHVLSKDFLDEANHPEITFTAAGGTAKSANSGTVTGDLTILGKTLPVTLNVTLNKAAPYPFGAREFVLGLSMDTTISRSEWGMTYGVDNGLVGDEVAIRIETEAVQQ